MTSLKKVKYYLVFLLAFIIMSNSLPSVFSADIQYLSPKPGSDFNLTNSQIIIRLTEDISLSQLNDNSLIVNGTKSGFHAGKFVVSESRTLIFKPYQNFNPDENITVRIKDDLFKNIDIKERVFSFKTINSSVINEPFVRELNTEDEEMGKPFFYDVLDTIPADLPMMTFEKNDLTKAYNGYILLAYQTGKANYVVIYDMNGNPYKWKKTNPFTFNLQLMPNGNYSYQESIAGVAPQAITRILDPEFNLIKSYQCGNGLLEFPSDYKYMPNGHSLMFARESQAINMREINPKGDPNAQVIGTVFQEIDANNNVVFQWRAIDYLPISECYENLTQSNINYSHINGIEIDTDGNYLVSTRHLAQIIKIDRNTGEMIWRLGGKNSDFTFINEHEENAPIYFNYQHNIVKFANGNIGLFDNGNIRPKPQYSRVVEYKLDEKNKTAEMVWEYRHTPDFYSDNKGGIQILKNGNRLINWGGATGIGQVMATELTPAGEEVMSLSIPKGLASYRTYKIDLPSCEPIVIAEKNDLKINENYTFNTQTLSTGVMMKLSEVNTSAAENSMTVTKYDCSPQNMDFEGLHPMILTNRITIETKDIESFTAIVVLDIMSYAKNLHLTNPSVYFREIIGEGKFRKLDCENVMNMIRFPITSTGELVIGGMENTERAQKPKLLLPADDTKLNSQKPIGFYWATSGRYVASEINIYKKNVEETVIYTKQTKSTSESYSIENPENGADYSWDVTSIDENGKSAISDRYKFTFAEPYIEMKSPIGGEIFYKDSSSYVLKWEDNLDDLVRIDLMQDDTLVMKIADSVSSPLNNIGWKIPNTIIEGNNFKIRVKSVNNTVLLTQSTENFTILDNPNSVIDDLLKERYSIRTYPNPLINSLNIKYKDMENGQVKVKLFNIEGKEIVINQEYLPIGQGLINLNLTSVDSGVYILKLEFNQGTYTEKIIKK